MPFRLRRSWPYVLKTVVNRGLYGVAAGLVLFYRYGLSPLWGPRCRFYPTCSAYALEALRTYGFFKGAGLAVRRILRCRPGGGSGYDPLPPPQDSETHR